MSSRGPDISIGTSLKVDIPSHGRPPAADVRNRANTEKPGPTRPADEKRTRPRRTVPSTFTHTEPTRSRTSLPFSSNRGNTIICPIIARAGNRSGGRSGRGSSALEGRSMRRGRGVGRSWTSTGRKGSGGRNRGPPRGKAREGRARESLDPSSSMMMLFWKG